MWPPESPKSRGQAPLYPAGDRDLCLSHRFREGREPRWRAGDPEEVLGGVARRPCRPESERFKLSLPEFWGISCAKPRAKGQGTQTCTETAACCSPRNRRPECGRRPVPPSLLLPLPFTPFPAIFLATPCITCLSPLSFSDLSTNSPRKSTLLCLSKEEDPQTLENGLSGVLRYYQTKNRFCF